MECKEAYNCLCAYLDGELDSGKVVSLEKHLGICHFCKTELEAQRFVKFLIQEQFLNITAPDYLKTRVIVELERAEEYRESGVQVLDLIPWGTHIAQTYKTKNEMVEIMVPYMEKGLEQNELCMWVTSEMSQEEARTSLTKEIPHLQDYIDKDQLQIFSYEDWYLPRGYFDSRCALDTSLKKCQEALSNGYSGLRITGNVSWVEQSDWDSFMEYENVLNSVVNDYKLLVICAYKENECTIDRMSDVLNAHEYVISKVDNSWRRRKV